jgi:hypothetical protein
MAIQVLTSKVGLGSINHLVLRRVERVDDLAHDGRLIHTRFTCQQAQFRGMPQPLESILDLGQWAILPQGLSLLPEGMIG